MSKCESLETATADSAAHIYRFFRMNAQDRVTNIEVQCDAVAGLTSANLGYYAINGGDEVDLNCYLATTDWHTGLDSGTTASLNYAFAVRNIANAKYKVWQDAGVTTDPGNVQYDFALMNDGDVSEAETITITIEYVAGS
jgi:hypothetical protein